MKWDTLSLSNGWNGQVITQKVSIGDGEAKPNAINSSNNFEEWMWNRVRGDWNENLILGFSCYRTITGV